MSLRLFLCFVMLCASGMPVSAAPLTVAVAANVKYAFDDLAAEFRKDTGIEVNGVFGAAGKIATQIKSGAPFDAFLSADTEYSEALYKDGLAVTQPRIYAYGVLVLWTAKDMDLNKGLPLLADASVQKIAIANPKVAPYGRAAMQALASAKLDAVIVPKLVYGESITQATQFVDSGAADIGFIAKSIVIAPELAGKGKWVAVTKGSYEPIAQAVVVLKHGANTQSEAAHKFVDFLFTPKARAIFEKYGYVLP
ncbi:MAG: molybdate ABC transporter substrate-binding protein [Nitrosomonadales bacterium]|nr:molybdate ABC transporter substrate-binding protein [Nitrosomonadales bacterium]